MKITQDYGEGLRWGWIGYPPPHPRPLPPGERGILGKDEREREIKYRRKNSFVSVSHKEPE